MSPIILASASPRRRELLTQIGLPFTVLKTATDETVKPGETPERYVERLARDKAKAGLKMSQTPDSLVLGADTSVVCAGRIMGKPTDQAHAQAMLMALSGRRHQVMTAVALAYEQGCQARLVTRLVTTVVQFRDLDEAEVIAYCQTGEPMDKAGAYGIQDRGGLFVAHMEGSYSAVVGLPLCETAELLAQAGLPVWQYWSRNANVSVAGPQ